VIGWTRVGNIGERRRRVRWERMGMFGGVPIQHEGTSMRYAKMSAAMLIAGALTGCWGAGSPVADGSGPDPVANVLAFGTTNPAPPPAPQKAAIDLTCPTVEVLDGTASMRAYAGGQSNGDVRYQYSLGDVARECSLQGNQIAIKVGVEGRVLIGPKGAPGSFSAPIRIAIRRESDHGVAISNLYHVPVMVPEGQTQAAFNFVADPIRVPFIEANADNDYTVIVGFDEAGGTGEKAVRRRKRGQ